MRISHLPANPRVPVARTLSAPPPPSEPPQQQDLVEIRSAQQKMWRAVEWGTFAGQLVGGGLVLAHQGAIGLAIFAASSAGMVYAGYKRSQAGSAQKGMRHINKPGEAVDIRKKLVPGKTNIVMFSAPWCPACVKAEPQIEQLMKEKPDHVTLKVDIDDGESAVARQYGVTMIPCYKIFDEKGALVSEGEEARTRVKSMLSQLKS